MTTELVILLGIFAFLLVGVFFGESDSFRATFERSSPKLGARLERHLETGGGFAQKSLENERGDQASGIRWSYKK